MQLVGASEADADVGFMARLLALCSLPRRNATGWKVSGAATQQACVVSGAGNEGFSAGIVFSGQAVGPVYRKAGRLTPPPLSRSGSS